MQLKKRISEDNFSKRDNYLTMLGEVLLIHPKKNIMFCLWGPLKCMLIMMSDLGKICLCAIDVFFR